MDTLPEWSKGVDSSSTSTSCVGSNPTGVKGTQLDDAWPATGSAEPCAMTLPQIPQAQGRFRCGQDLHFLLGKVDS